MRFGSVPIDLAEGAILAHALKLPGGRIGKGTRLAATDVEQIRAAGIAEVTAAVLGDDDMTEDEAAALIGTAAAAPGVAIGPAATGRVNFFAATAGLFLPDRSLVDRLNAVDPGITLATLKEYEPVVAGQMLATVKIIPLAVPGPAVSAAVALLNAAPAFRLSPYRALRVALIQTELPGIKRGVLDKTREVLGRRLDAAGSVIVSETRCAHQRDPLAAAIRAVGEVDLTVVFGASAVIDAGDVIPAAVEAAGGTVLQLGMPVDPGNLLLLGAVHGKPLLGAPGCARSPKENGFDWVLGRLLADVPVTAQDIRGMGVGGLLMEIPTRPQPRERAAKAPVGARMPLPAAVWPKTAPVVDAVILAAGRSSRMGGPNKLLATFDGVPLVRRSALTALGSPVRRVRVVLGHRAGDMRHALAGLDLDHIDNLAYADGLSTSVIAGCKAAFADGADGVLVMLADQPMLAADDLTRLLRAFEREGPGSLVAATASGELANPVLLSRKYRPEILSLSGDVGARRLLATHADMLRTVEIGDAARIDVDTPEALAQAGGVLGS